MYLNIDTILSNMDVLNANYTEFTLDNGFGVALQKTPTQTIFAELNVNYGALHEKPGQNGYAHLTEHTIIKGGGNSFTPEQVQKFNGKTVRYMDGGTGLAKTYFLFDMLGENVNDELFDFFSDKIFFPGFDEETVGRGKGVVLREIGESKEIGFSDKVKY